ncbi:MAG: hypothetical protein DWH91_08545 [Planctomycetota bacterium]|nr:MAG: hypothetical protein DWH91_08545 [Planctomycetota bacterium]
MTPPSLVLRALLIVTFVLSWAESTSAQDAGPQASIEFTASASLAASPLEDDATLHAVTFVGARTGWAVGDRGVCWITRDGGQKWIFSRTPVRCALRDVCFLTDRVGWAVGAEVAPYTRFASGVILHTTDGGLNWKILSQGQLPPLFQVQFLDDQLGFVIGEATPRCPTGILISTDAGTTWEAVNGPRATSWRTAALTSQGTGIVAGPRGSLGLVGRGQLARTIDQFQGLRAIHAVSLTEDGRGWLVGDGGWALQTSNGGTSWSPPNAALPSRLRDCMEFLAVAQHEDHVWIAGSPGSVIWHSPDSGQRWEALPTGETTPWRSLHFTSPTQGVAVGDLGKILRTTDGGQTWQPVRAGGRHLAYLTIQARPDQIPLATLTKYSAEWGYRSGTILLTRRDLGTDSERQRPLSLRADEALSSVGANVATVDWRLPLTVPGLDRDRNKLLDEWSLLTDQKLPEVVLTDLIAQIRTWQPEVILLSEPSADDAAGRIVFDAALKAIDQAADPLAGHEVTQLLGLAPWSVSKVFTRTIIPQAGPLTVHPREMLVRVGSPVDQLVEPALARLLDTPPILGMETLRLIHSRIEADTTTPTLFGGLEIPTNGPMRRAHLPTNLNGLEKRQQDIKTREGFVNFSRQLMIGPEGGQQLIAQLRSKVAAISPDEGAKLLSDVARDYRDRMLFEGAEQAYSLLLDLYPDHPAAPESAAWLLRFWASSEIGWLRIKPRLSQRGESQTDRAILQAEFQQGLHENQKLPGTLSVPELSPSITPIQQAITPVRVKPRGLVELVAGQEAPTQSADLLTLQAEQWRGSADRITGLVDRTAPGFFREPEIQLAVAALMRRSSRPAESDKIIDELLKLDSKDAWNQLAQGEIWLLRPQIRSPRPVATCRRTTLPPRLDGELQDACWEGATELFLTEQPAEASREFMGAAPVPTAGVQILKARPMVLMLYDDRFLYLAGTMPRQTGLSLAPSQQAGRTHDADLNAYDRISFALDTDRDYNTFYRLDVDQRGHTRDACWEFSGWNPKWYVASAGDDQVWRFEAAIPWTELAPAAPQPSTFWAIGITRTLPTVGLQGWNHPVTETPSPQTFGLLRFE